MREIYIPNTSNTSPDTILEHRGHTTFPIFYTSSVPFFPTYKRLPACLSCRVCAKYVAIAIRAGRVARLVLARLARARVVLRISRFVVARLGSARLGLARLGLLRLVLARCVL